MQKRFHIILFICLMVFCNCTGNKNQTKTEDLIHIWYGENQQFGAVGNTQKQINILGNVELTTDSISLFYTLNNDTNKHWLTLGSDLHRLANRGDFNIEIFRNELNAGENTVHVSAIKKGGILDKKKIKVEYQNNKRWPLPYSVIWNSVTNIQEVVQIIDGRWELVKSGIRVKDRYYDRIIAIGDSTWKNYEVKSSIIFHGFTVPKEGPPTYNVSHVAIASRWPGHDIDSLQPNRKWFPLGATSEFRITSDYDSCRWRIFDGENFYSEQTDASFRKIQPKTKYNIKHRVENISPTKVLYSVKFWNAKETEPAAWDFQAEEESELQETGSACFIAHHTDVTFGDIYVTEIE